MCESLNERVSADDAESGFGITAWSSSTTSCPRSASAQAAPAPIAPAPAITARIRPTSAPSVIARNLDKSATISQDRRHFDLFASTLAESHPDPQLSATVHEALRQAILSGALGPNEHVNQDRVARELGVSRTPVREALRWLERDGLVRMEPNRGAFVQAFSTDDVFEIYELRELLEPHAAGIAAAVATRADVQAVRSLQEAIELARAVDLQEGFELNRAFHARLCAPCRNGLLMSVLGQVWSQGSALRIFTHYAQAGPELRARPTSSTA